jgi:hypothetical protein
MKQITYKKKGGGKLDKTMLEVLKKNGHYCTIGCFGVLHFKAILVEGNI